jgi:predicted nuclease of predicted toxin-antitoxin system
MRIKLDENLPVCLALLLTNLGHDVDTVHEEKLTGRADRDIWEATQRERRFLITQDLDFSDSRQFTPGSHCGIPLVRLRSPNRANLIDRVQEVFRQETITEWSGCFVVTTERKVRALKPPEKQSS